MKSHDLSRIHRAPTACVPTAAGLIAALACSSALAAAADAPTSRQDDSSDKLEQIVVTAERRATDL